jgi:hypothetical protein
MATMFRHVVMFSWSDTVDDAHVAAAAEAFDALPAKVDVIRSYVHGRDAGLAPGNADYVVVADFDDADGFTTYRDHPDHVALVQRFIAGFTAQRLAVQYRIA